MKKNTKRTVKKKLEISRSATGSNELFARIVAILEQARANVVRAVDQQMDIAYWLIGREIVQETQEGERRAAYGKQVIESLSKMLTEKFGNGYSTTSLQYFRKFYQTYIDRITIPRPLGVKSGNSHKFGKIPRPLGVELQKAFKSQILEENKAIFSPQLSWSHYRALMRVTKVKARDFYEQETIACGWDKRTLERQIHSYYYERMLKSQNPQKMLQAARKEIIEKSPAIDALKNPMVLEFLGLPDVPSLHETQLESAIITHLQLFLLELGKGFSFVARQKRMQFEDKDLFIDLVFYNCVLKCYLLIELKMGELSHQDVGQMDGYVRMFDDLHTAKDDNPTIGLILCTEKNEAVAKYSVLKDRKTIFASKYILYLPTEKELIIELARERKLIEEKLTEEGKF